MSDKNDHAQTQWRFLCRIQGIYSKFCGAPNGFEPMNTGCADLELAFGPCLDVFVCICKIKILLIISSSSTKPSKQVFATGFDVILRPGSGFQRNYLNRAFVYSNMEVPASSAVAFAARTKNFCTFPSFTNAGVGPRSQRTERIVSPSCSTNSG